MRDDLQLSRREREIMDALFKRGKASAREIWKDLGEDCSYSTIRKLLSILEEKEIVTHEVNSGKFIYSPASSKEEAAGSMIDRLLNTFFQGSVEGAVSGLLGRNRDSLTKEQLERMGSMIAEAKKEAKS